MRLLQKYFLLTIGLSTAILPEILHAQISDSLFHVLPVKARPVSKKMQTVLEIRQILTAASEINNEVFRGELEKLAAILKHDADNAADVKTKVENTSALAEYYSSCSDDSSIKYHKRVIEYTGNDKRYTNLKGDSYLIIALMYSYKDKFDSAVKSLHQGELAIGLQKDSNFLRQVNNTYCLLYSRLQLYDKAVFSGNQALRWYTLKLKGGVDHTQQLLTNAINYSLLFDRTRQAAYRDTAYNIIYDVMERKQADSASWFGGCYYFLGYLDYLQKNYQHAIVLFDSSMMPVYNRSSRYLNNYDYGRYLYKSVCLLQLGQYQKAMQILGTLEIGPGRFSSKQVLYQALYKQAEKSGDFKDAYLYHLKYTLYSDSLDIQGQKGKVFEAEQKYSVAEKQAAIVTLENDNLKKEKDRQRLANIAFVVALMLLIIVAALYLAYKRQQFRRLDDRRRLTDELHKIELEMQLQQKRDIEDKNKAMLEQRKNISRDMHDELSPGLAALSFFVGDVKKRVRDSYDRQLFEEVEMETQNMYRHARDFMHGLFNNSLTSQYNVPEFLHTLSSRFDARGSLQVIASFDEAAINSSLSTLQHSELYCIIREAVANSMKYADASIVKIDIVVGDSALQFEIKDNGKGMDVANTALGIGLESMKERIAGLDGSLQFDTSATGMNVSGSFPLQNL